MNMTTSMNTTDSGASNSSDSSSMMDRMMMKSYLHFTGGDTVLFTTIVPTSHGAIFATCLVFFLISVGDRYLRTAVRSAERHFAQRAKQLTSAHYHFANTESGSEVPATETKAPAPAVSQRFILSNELTRGALAGLQSTLHYLLMLVVMFVLSFPLSPVLKHVVT
ncbi:Ctr copper transporter family-domain-containing protein [Mycena metata]|uniref:Copper transport protein n=1 Tax=Mycena metata TaxID=1033252 RepID=A0AAD7JKE4_9AGAR|nr:Ctr copper transporter family-domain-containing protein [Mycena metata]